MDDDARRRSEIRMRCSDRNIPALDVSDPFQAMAALGRSQFRGILITEGRRHLSVRGLCRLARKQSASMHIFILQRDGGTLAELRQNVEVDFVALPPGAPAEEIAAQVQRAFSDAGDTFEEFDFDVDEVDEVDEGAPPTAHLDTPPAPAPDVAGSGDETAAVTPLASVVAGTEPPIESPTELSEDTSTAPSPRSREADSRTVAHRAATDEAPSDSDADLSVSADEGPLSAVHTPATGAPGLAADDAADDALPHGRSVAEASQAPSMPEDAPVVAYAPREHTTAPGATAAAFGSSAGEEEQPVSSAATSGGEASLERDGGVVDGGQLSALSVLTEVDDGERSSAATSGGSLAGTGIESGRLDAGALRDGDGTCLLIELFSREVSGRLEVTLERGAMVLFLYRGELVWVYPTGGDATVYRRLVERGQLSPDYVVDAVEDGALLRTLVSQGVLAAEQVQPLMRDLVRDSALEVFQAQLGEYRLVVEPEHASAAPPFRVNPFGLLLENLRKGMTPDRLLSIAHEMQSGYVHPLPALAPMAHKLAPFVRDLDVTQVIDGTHTLSDISDVTGLDVLMGTLLALAMRDAGLVRFSETPRAATPGATT